MNKDPQKLKWIDSDQSMRMHKIAPVWNKMLQQGKFYLDGFLARTEPYDIDSYSSCAVGEFHKYDSSYANCDLCYAFSRLLAYDAPSVTNSPVNFRKDLDSFLLHAESKHRELLRSDQE